MANLHPHRITSRPLRRLRVFARDPSLATQLETVDINEITLKVPWEADRLTGQDTLEPGPVGEYLEVIDYDPASDAFYAPVDLNDRYLLAQDGLSPSVSNPQFHQQMVYAVAMTTIGHFERALGRVALWAPRQKDEEGNYLPYWKQFVQRLRIYPHALREANAFYSPAMKALLLGYFPASDRNPGLTLPGGIVFTCLSHDIVAHETTHALLDGMHRRFSERTNPDVLALHEGFSDIVALFQHFTNPEALRQQIAQTQGDLASQNMLAKLAQQFGQAIGLHGALRDALGEGDPRTDAWKRTAPDPHKLENTLEPHSRGAILVAAVFNAFLGVYKSRVADLLRIATSGTGELPAGVLHPDLVNRMANEAAKTARHYLHMCIRALDYCPPVDITFGDYLRALITADSDLVAEDRFHYRVAVIEAFRQYGIYPSDVRNLSTESLTWKPPQSFPNETNLHKLIEGKLKAKNRTLPFSMKWDLFTDREKAWAEMNRNAISLHTMFAMESDSDWTHELGLVMEAKTCEDEQCQGIFRTKNSDRPALEVHSVRTARRQGPSGEFITELVIEITQRRRGYFDPVVQRRIDNGETVEDADPDGDFTFRGGCTLLVDPSTGHIRYAITKSIRSEARLAKHREFLAKPSGSLRAMYFGRHEKEEREREPFALLHREIEETTTL